MNNPILQAQKLSVRYAPVSEGTKACKEAKAKKEGNQTKPSTKISTSKQKNQHNQKHHNHKKPFQRVKERSNRPKQNLAVRRPIVTKRSSAETDTPHPRHSAKACDNNTQTTWRSGKNCNNLFCSRRARNQSATVFPEILAFGWISKLCYC